MLGLQLQYLVFWIPIILITITIHEFAHAKVADMLGDPTPRYAGRLTLNPIKHIDPLGLLMLILVRFGWAKPVPVNPYNFKDPARGMAMVAFAGPLSNLFTAWLLASLTKFVLIYIGIAEVPLVLGLIQYAIWINIALALFNLIPIPPLDGGNILQAFLPPRYAYVLRGLERYGFIILIAFIFLGGLQILVSLVNLIYQLLMS